MKPTRASTADLEAIAMAMLRIRRRQTRRTWGKQARARAGVAVSMSQLGVIDAVQEGPAAGEEGVTVGDVATRLGVDPSRASRAVADALDVGLVVRVSAQRDAHRVHIALTPRGRALADRVHALRREMLAAATADWSAADRRTLARLLTRLVDALDRLPDRSA